MFFISLQSLLATLLANSKGFDRRLKHLEATEEEMDGVHKALGLPKGTKPKWYCCNYYEDGADSSRDKVWPNNEIYVPILQELAEEDDGSSGAVEECDEDTDSASDETNDSDDTETN
ncbi:hypothetical protein A7U60_g1136 [Sanghuangporus baumii]|uniref:Uncharacterized protein n=1 Tax=Sanghuangporus baumii TaxID=108892 RepID=A0A9Q5I4P0_SANBA|nr:hypothetical protein A7U60_g1136 [Sanghuangporus baumii]